MLIDVTFPAIQAMEFLAFAPPKLNQGFPQRLHSFLWALVILFLADLLCCHILRIHSTTLLLNFTSIVQITIKFNMGLVLPHINSLMILYLCSERLNSFKNSFFEM